MKNETGQHENTATITHKEDCVIVEAKIKSKATGEERLRLLLRRVISAASKAEFEVANMTDEEVHAESSKYPSVVVKQRT